MEIIVILSSFHFPISSNKQIYPVIGHGWFIGNHSVCSTSSDSLHKGSVALGTNCVSNYRIGEGYFNWSVSIYINSPFRWTVLCNCESFAENSGEFLILTCEISIIIIISLEGHFLIFVLFFFIWYIERFYFIKYNIFFVICKATCLRA